MTGALIKANQVGIPPGVAGISRRDASLGLAVTITNADNAGVRSWRWLLVDKPSTSVATLSNGSSPTAQFTPDIAGTYLVQLSVDDGRAGQVARLAVAVLTDFGGLSPRPLRIPAAGEVTEANWRYDFGATVDPNKRGWVPDLLELIIYGGGAAGVNIAADLEDVLGEGNTTGPNDIILTTGQAVRGETTIAVDAGSARLLGGAQTSGVAALSGGDADVIAGSAFSVNGTAGAAKLFGGQGLGDGTAGGDARVVGGAGTNLGNGGDATLQSGDGGLSGDGGWVRIVVAGGGANAGQFLLTEPGGAELSVGAGSFYATATGDMGFSSGGGFEVNSNSATLSTSGDVSIVATANRYRTPATPATDYVETKTFRTLVVVPLGGSVLLVLIGSLTADGRQITFSVNAWGVSTTVDSSVSSWRGEGTFIRSGGVVTALPTHTSDTKRAGAAGTLGQLVTIQFYIGGNDIYLLAASSGASVTGMFTGTVQAQMGGA